MMKEIKKGEHNMKTVFLTGGTGTMGWAAFQELYKQKDVRINFLARPSDKNKQKLLPYMGQKNVEIIWGDFLDYDAILKGVTGADYVLHIGGEHLQGRAGPAQR